MQLTWLAAGTDERLSTVHEAFAPLPDRNTGKAAAKHGCNRLRGGCIDYGVALKSEKHGELLEKVGVSAVRSQKSSFEKVRIPVTGKLKTSLQD